MNRELTVPASHVRLLVAVFVSAAFVILGCGALAARSLQPFRRIPRPAPVIVECPAAPPAAEASAPIAVAPAPGPQEPKRRTRSRTERPPAHTAPAARIGDCHGDPLCNLPID